MNSSETAIIAAITLVAFGVLAWGFARAKPYGKLGVLAWLQSVVLIAPWLLYFGSLAAGIYINIAGLLFLAIGFAGVYIAIGRQLRAMGQEEMIKKKASERIAEDRKSTRLNSSHVRTSRMPSSA